MTSEPASICRLDRAVKIVWQIWIIVRYGATVKDTRIDDHYRMLSAGYRRCVVGLVFFVAESALSAPSSLDVCVDYECDIERAVFIAPGPWQQVRNLLSQPDSAQAERAATAEAIGRMERIVGNQVGTAADLPRNSAGYGGPGQLDCIAESINTERYLRLFEKASLLRWHKVMPRTLRRRYLFSMHWTAVIKETDSNRLYAVDSWYGMNGDEAFVISLDEWRQGVAPARLTDSNRLYETTR